MKNRRFTIVFPASWIGDLFLEMLSVSISDAFVAEVRTELEEARNAGNDVRVSEIHGRFSYRMHNLSEFMKTLLQRFTRYGRP